ncbi:MAG TPA: glycosyltransferase family 2 protein [Kiritimatiellia bacterium]|jgi:glycosyltransferase involved in cell wall biosynthesis|nr:glycosyltransferase family 2 protein [Kiritimatiellia bacterium]HOR73863.1 glycosyltransferase family 2 protein [Kiritimatiellia bacterium]HPV46490.1 glycosyltransferase family 2 protein [Kiritimatiellia bacterium]HQK43839.1 glycosyltransferase family 2 protein [Kiritimatiellia bacterium]HQM22082.1 glycosyltransferase family 2 protein [Kiritimatiellia bacterium]
MTTTPFSLSVVIPVYNEEPNVAVLAKKVHDALSAFGRTYEIILVDDGSRDASWERLCEAARTYPHFRLIRFRRNFGQTAAMSAGIDAAKHDVIVTLDADLQNDPADIPLLLAEMERNDYAVVSGWRKDRKDPFINRRLPSILANGLISRITGVHLHDYGCTLKAYRRNVLQGVRLYGEMHRFIPALCSWVGGEIAEVVVSHHPRVAGKSKYGIGRTFRVILDLFTVKFLLRFTGGPMQLFGKIAFLFGGGAAIMLLIVLLERLFGSGGAEHLYLIKRPFWVITPFMLLAFCMQFISMGLLAEVQIRTYHESQDKRIYAIRETFESPPAA